MLTKLLVDGLERSAPARVVTVASGAHTMGRIDFDDLQDERSYSGSRAYNQSKLANVLFTYELARRVQTGAITANAVHPGMVNTSFGASDPGAVQRILVPYLRPFMKSATKGAATSIYVASAPALEHTSSRYFANSKPKKSSPDSYDPAVAARLWQVSADLVGLGRRGRLESGSKHLDSGVSGTRLRSARSRRTLCAASGSTERGPIMASELIIRDCTGTVLEALGRLTDALDQRGVRLFAVVDHSGAAREVSLELADEVVAIFGNPSAGTAVISTTLGPGSIFRSGVF